MNNTLEIVNVITLFSDFYDISKSEVRRLLNNRGLYINNVQVVENRIIDGRDFLFGKYILLRIGKANYLIVKF